jgi:hypothetical protein
MMSPSMKRGVMSQNMSLEIEIRRKMSVPLLVWYVSFNKLTDGRDEGSHDRRIKRTQEH